MRIPLLTQISGLAGLSIRAGPEILLSIIIIAALNILRHACHKFLESVYIAEPINIPTTNRTQVGEVEI